MRGFVTRFFFHMCYPCACVMITHFYTYVRTLLVQMCSLPLPQNAMHSPTSNALLQKKSVLDFHCSHCHLDCHICRLGCRPIMRGSRNPTWGVSSYGSSISIEKSIPRIVQHDLHAMLCPQPFPFYRAVYVGQVTR